MYLISNNLIKIKIKYHNPMYCPVTLEVVAYLGLLRKPGPLAPPLAPLDPVLLL